MKKKSYPYFIFYIFISLAATFTLQIYWNVKNYEANKKNLYKEVVTAFDKSIEHYYLEDLKNDHVVILNTSSSEKNDFDKINFDSILKNREKKEIDKIHITIQDSVKFKKDYLQKKTIKILKGKKSVDSILRFKLKNVITFSINRDSINLLKISKTFENELKRKKIVVNYKIEQFNFKKKIQTFDKNKIPNYEFATFSNSIDIPRNSKLKIYFQGSAYSVLKRGFSEILISIFLSFLLLGCVFYLLKIINNQKQIAEIKNDFISNITHELKTPIAIVSSAIEGIQHFNTNNDVDKTNKYLSISNQELEKLNQMVEKILDMATLESKELQLKKESVNINKLISKCVENAKEATKKKLLFEFDDTMFLNLDSFHFENVITNLLENAIKYGGETIEIKVKKIEETIEIYIEDNGIGIPKSQHKKIFEKFYRIPTQNIHNVKGFGIGLYYVKQIIEKHKGSIQLLPNEIKTIFKIIVPNV